MQQLRSVRRAFLLADLPPLCLRGSGPLRQQGRRPGEPQRAIRRVRGLPGRPLRHVAGRSADRRDASSCVRSPRARTTRTCLQQAFIASLVAGRPEAVQLAHQLPDSQAAQLLLGEVEVRAGHWQAAEQQFHALPRQGLTQLLQPLLVAWAQQGDGRTDAALATLRPLLDGQRFRGVYALHAALIADQAGRTADAAKFYHLAQTEFGGTNLRLAQILASWEARHGHPAEAQQHPGRHGRR